MSTDEKVVNRRRLIRRLSEMLDELPTDKVSNNDIRRLIDGYPLAFTHLQHMDKYPKEFPHIDPNHVLLPDHCSSTVLDRYAVRSERQAMSPELVAAAKRHLSQCSACLARLRWYESQLVLGQRVKPGDPNEPRRVAIDDPEYVGRGPTTLAPSIGIAAGSPIDGPIDR